MGKSKTGRTLQRAGVCHHLYVKSVYPWAAVRRKVLEINLHSHYLLMRLDPYPSSFRYFTARASHTVVSPGVQPLQVINRQALGFPLPVSYQKSESRVTHQSHSDDNARFTHPCVNLFKPRLGSNCLSPVPFKILREN